MKYEGICKSCGKKIVISDSPEWASKVFGSPKNYKVPKICHSCKMKDIDRKCQQIDDAVEKTVTKSFGWLHK